MLDDPWMAPRGVDRRGRNGWDIRCSLVMLAVVTSSIAACDGLPVGGEPGQPLPGLTATERAAFTGGLALFEKVYLPEEGVGPLFNENQCSACHTSPAPGGTTGFEFVRRGTRFEDGVCDLLSAEGGENLRTKATPLLRAHGVEGEVDPPSATAIGRFTTPFLFGLGLVEAIPAETILSREDPDDLDGDGISGRAGRTSDGRVARFGRKADVATVREFIGTALRFEMGITTPDHPEEETINGRPMPPETDPAPDPEITDAQIDLLTAFVRFLVPPAPMVPRSDAHADSIAAGRTLFERIGCAGCHVPSMRTGPSSVPALDRKTVALYSDLLLHDMGPAFADACGPTATPSEVRTEMLMGLQHRGLYLHDGRSRVLRDVILGHGGEARGARDAFAALSEREKLFVVLFLQSL